MVSRYPNGKTGPAVCHSCSKYASRSSGLSSNVFFVANTSHNRRTVGRSAIWIIICFRRSTEVAPGTETTDREVPVDPHAPHVVGDTASERLDPSERLHPTAPVPPTTGHIPTRNRTSPFSAR